MLEQIVCQGKYLLTRIFLHGIKQAMGLISTKEAADRLGITSVRIQVLIREGRLPAERIGRIYVIKEEDLKLVEDRKPGRPSKKRKATKKAENKKKVKSK